MGAWCLLLGVINYLYFGLCATGWIDPGVYSVTIGLLMAFGFGLVYAANSPELEENSSLFFYSVAVSLSSGI